MITILLIDIFVLYSRSILIRMNIKQRCALDCVRFPSKPSDGARHYLLTEVQTMRRCFDDWCWLLDDLLSFV